MIGTSIAGLAIGLGTTIYGAVKQKKAEEEYQQRLDEAGDVTNPYAGLQPSTLGSQYRGQQSLRSESTQMNLLSKAGSRGLAMIPQVARQTSLVAQQDAADLNRQQSRIDQLVGRGEIFRQQIEENRLNTDLSGYAQMYGAGEQTMAGGINMTAGVLASGFAEGGAFNQAQGQQQLRPYATGAYPTTAGVNQNLQGFQPTLRPQQLINN